jgi:hypothetical protein
MKRLSVTSLTVIALFLAGCGEDDADKAASPPKAPATPTASPTEAATTTPEAEATEEASTGGSAKVTPLGTKLKVGQPAVIDYTDSSTNDKSIIELTPKKIEKGTLDDFKNIDLDEDQKSATPYYATIEVKNVGDGDLSGGDPATYINGVDDRGQDQNEIIFFGDFERCDHETPKKFKPGDTYSACLVYLIPKGGSLEGFHWIQFDEKSGKSDLNWE